MSRGFLNQECSKNRRTQNSQLQSTLQGARALKIRMRFPIVLPQGLKILLRIFRLNLNYDNPPEIVRKLQVPMFFHGSSSSPNTHYKYNIWFTSRAVFFLPISKDRSIALPIHRLNVSTINRADMACSLMIPQMPSKNFFQDIFHLPVDRYNTYSCFFCVLSSKSGIMNL